MLLIIFCLVNNEREFELCCLFMVTLFVTIQQLLVANQRPETIRKLLPLAIIVFLKALSFLFLKKNLVL